ncbi:hypothetical protein [Hyphomonas sp.]
MAKPPSDFDKLKSTPESAKDVQIAELERDLESTRDRRREDWFIFAFIGMIIFDVHAFAAMPDWGGAIAIMALQIFLLLILGRRLGVNDVTVWTNRALNSWRGNNEQE